MNHANWRRPQAARSDSAARSSRRNVGDRGWLTTDLTTVTCAVHARHVHNDRLLDALGRQA